MTTQKYSFLLPYAVFNRTNKVSEFRILTLGQRGVGKTVFIMGAYVHLLNNPEKITVKPQDSATEKNIQKLLKYIKERGQYPPATPTVNNFNFVLTKNSKRVSNKLYTFSLIDIPGELCELVNENYQKTTNLQELVLNSHACCAFFDAYALVNNENYFLEVSSIINQLSTVASIAANNESTYPIAIIFTKCDLLGLPLNIFPVEERAAQIIEQLNAVRATYKRFYSAVQIVKENSEIKISSWDTGQSSGGVAILWLLQLLSEAHSEGNLNFRAHLDALTSPELKQYINPFTKWRKIRRISFAALAAFTLLAVPSWLFSQRRQQTADSSLENSIKENQAIIRSQPNNEVALINLVNLYLQAGENSKALPVMQKLVKLEPESNEWKLNLARLYLANGRTAEAEKVYDQILKSDKNNVTALKEKAALLNSH